ncbi:MAG: glycosyl hydrolase [Solirubrobacterales bacterium]
MRVLHQARVALVLTLLSCAVLAPAAAAKSPPQRGHGDQIGARVGHAVASKVRPSRKRNAKKPPSAPATVGGGQTTPSPAPQPGPVPSPAPAPSHSPAPAPTTPAPTPSPETPAPFPTPTTPAPSPEQPAGPASSLYWGAWVGTQYTGTEAPWDMNALAKFEALAGKQVSTVHFAAPFADCSRKPCSFYGFPTTPMESIRKRGAIPFFSWSSQSTPSSLNEPDFQLSDVIAGTYDSYIRSFATAAKSWGHPFFLRFNWEMNGNWFPWSEGVNGNQPGEYVAAWRHVHDIFTAAGASNVTWTWCPNVDSESKLTDLASLYPGDDYVDWTSLDGYNWGGSEWTSFSDLYRTTYQRIVDKIAPTKPMVIAEVGSSENGGSKSAWIAEMLKQLPTEFPQIRGVVWFDKFIDGDWPIETSAAATQAFAAGIQSAPFRGADYGSLGGGPVAPPS